jgi:hypothetical protein
MVSEVVQPFWAALQRGEADADDSGQRGENVERITALRIRNHAQTRSVAATRSSGTSACVEPGRPRIGSCDRSANVRSRLPRALGEVPDAHRESTSHDRLMPASAAMPAAPLIAALAHAGVGAYLILYLAVAASWIGIPIVGAGALAAAGVLASDGELNIWLVILVAWVAASTGGYVGYWLGQRAGGVVTDRDGRWQRERRQAMASGTSIYRRRGRLAV